MTKSIVYYTISIVNYTFFNQGSPVELGNHLKQLRFEHNNISQQDLANAVGVTRLTIHSIETGKFNPSTLLSLKIARYFGKSLEEVFFILENES